MVGLACLKFDIVRRLEYGGVGWLPRDRTSDEEEIGRAPCLETRTAAGLTAGVREAIRSRLGSMYGLSRVEWALEAEEGTGDWLAEMG